jgi:hypothetical protein
MRTTAAVGWMCWRIEVAESRAMRAKYRLLVLTPWSGMTSANCSANRRCSRTRCSAFAKAGSAVRSAKRIGATCAVDAPRSNAVSSGWSMPIKWKCSRSRSFRPVVANSKPLAELVRDEQVLEAETVQREHLQTLAARVEDFRTAVAEGLEYAGFAQRRALVELLIDRVVVDGADVEIRYVIPLSGAARRKGVLRPRYRASQ